MALALTLVSRLEGVNLPWFIYAVPLALAAFWPDRGMTIFPAWSLAFLFHGCLRRLALSAGAVVAARFLSQAPWSWAWFGAIWIAVIFAIRFWPLLQRALMAGHIGRWAARMERGVDRAIERMRLGAWALGLTVCLSVVWAGQRLFPGMEPNLVRWGAVAVLWSIWHGVAAALRLSRLRRLFLGGAVLFAIVATGTLEQTTVEALVSTLQLWLGVLIALTTLDLIGRHVSLRSGTSYEREALRLSGIIASGVVLVVPYLALRVVGSGDAVWYGTVAFDAVTQIRSGQFPLWVGLSEHQFNGSIYPLRVAPGFQQAVAIMDALTWCRLSPLAVMNTLLGCMMGAAGLSAYLVLSWINPVARTRAFLLALLFAMCPGVIGLLYNTDLFMSVMTVAWVPLAVGGLARSFVDQDRQRSLLVAALGVGGAWWGHTPIAL